MSLTYGPVQRFGSFYRWRAVYRNETHIGFVVCERRRWRAALPSPRGIYDYVRDADGWAMRWRTREGAVTALAMVAEGLPLWSGADS